MYIDINSEVIKSITTGTGKRKLELLKYIAAEEPVSFPRLKEHVDNFIQRKKDVEIYDDGNYVRGYLRSLEKEGLIVCDSSKRPYLYKLSDELKRTKSISIKTKDIPYLTSWKNLFEKYKFLPFFDDMNGFIKEMENDKGYVNSISTKRDYRIADFETAQSFLGIDFIDKFYNAIDDSFKIDFVYKSFYGKPKRHLDFCPYLLKEHKKRWYVVGKFKPLSEFKVFALDRVTEVINYSPSRSEFDRELFNPDLLWQHSMGIDLGWADRSTGEYRNDPIEISFEVKDGSELDNIAYLETSPIHPSQKLKKLKDGYVKVSMNTFPVADAVRSVRALGVHNLRNIKPDYFDKWVREE